MKAATSPSETLGRIEHDGGPCPLPPDTIIEAFGVYGGRHIGRAGHMRLNWALVAGYRLLVPAGLLEPLIEEVQALRDCIVECSTVRGDLATLDEHDAQEVRRLDKMLAAARAGLGERGPHA